MQTRIIGAQFDLSLARRLHVEAARRDLSKSELLRQAVADFLERAESDATVLVKPAEVRHGDIQRTA